MRASRGISIHSGMAFLRNEFYNMSIYRVSFWINLFYTFLMMYSVGYVWRALYAANPNVSGVPLPQMISYAVLGVALEAILHPRNGPQIYIMEQVRKGTIEMDIMKPIDFQFYMFAKNMGSIAVRFLFLVLPSLIVAFFLFSLKLPDLSALFGFLCSLVFSIIVSFFLNFILGLLSMITMNIRNINWGYNALLRFFSGQMVPLWIFPSALGVISDFLPFRCIYAIPMSIYIGNYAGIFLASADAAVTIVEVMGRNAGWLTAASALARNNGAAGPSLIYLCEPAFSVESFLDDVKKKLEQQDSVLVAISEGIKDKNGVYISEQVQSGAVDNFGHSYIAGSARVLEDIVRREIGCKVRSIELNLMQRCASHIASKTDIQESKMLGMTACRCALQGKSGLMASVERLGSHPYQVRYTAVPVCEVSNQEKKVPDDYINEAGNDVTEKMMEYLKPLIHGETEIIYENGIPKHLYLY